MRQIARMLATFFFVGLVPIAPGTAGSIAAIAVALAVHVSTGISAAVFGISALLLLAPAIWAAGRVAQDMGSKDPQIVVVDEVVGQWLTLAGATALNWKSWILALLLFRGFDVWKPPPVRQLEGIPGGAGIVLDDAMAGIYAALVLYAAGWFNLY